MEVNILSFGSLTEVLPSGKVMEDFLADTDALKECLIAKYPLLANRKFMLAVNKKMIQSNTTLYNGDVVAVVPPFSGG